MQIHINLTWLICQLVFRNFFYFFNHIIKSFTFPLKIIERHPTPKGQMSFQEINYEKPIGTPGLEPAARLNGSCSLPIGEVFRICDPYVPLYQSLGGFCVLFSEPHFYLRLQHFSVFLPSKYTDSVAALVNHLIRSFMKSFHQSQSK